MAGSVLSGLTMNPNYHEFGPSLMENELAKIATGGRAGLAYSMGNRAHEQRLEDNENYYNRLDQGDALRQGYAMSLGAQGQATEKIKMLTAALAHEGVPAGAAMRIANRILGEQPMATPELDQSDRNSTALGAGNAIKSVGEGVDKLMGGGVKLPASSLDGFLKSIIGGGGYDVAPTTVQAAGVKAAADAKPYIDTTSTGFVTGDKDAFKLHASPADTDRLLRTELGSKLFPGARTQIGNTAPGLGPPAAAAPPAGPTIMPQSGLAVGGGMNAPPPMAGGANVGPLTSAAPDQTPAGNAGNEGNMQPAYYDEHNRVIALQQQQGHQLGTPQPMGDGSLLIPRQQKNGTRDNLRIFRDPSQKNGYNTRAEPL